MNTALAEFRFYADLNDFLPEKQRQQTFQYPVYDGSQSVKHLIEAIGIPHTEVDVILRNQELVDFSCLVQAGDRISVYPPFITSGNPSFSILRPPLPHPVSFLLDNHLGRLARYLRLFGFDAQYFNNLYDDEQLAQIAQQSHRVLLSRDRGLLKRNQVIYGYCLRTKDAKKQLQAVIHRYRLALDIQPWRRCLRCNGLLSPVSKESISKYIEPKTDRYFNEFRQCEDCRQIYWKGSHYRQLEELIADISNGFR